MAIDPFTEEIVTLPAAARLLPKLNRNRPLNVSTIWRWAKSGIRGTKLEITCVGGRTVTSKEAMRRFLTGVNAARNSTTPPMLVAGQHQSLANTCPLPDRRQHDVAEELNKRFGL